MRIYYLQIALSLWSINLASQNLIKNINLGEPGSNINHIQSTTSGVIFTAFDAQGSRNLYFTSDTLEDPITLFRTGVNPANQWIWSPRALGDSVFFFELLNNNVKLYMSLPTQDTTFLLKSWLSNSGFSDGDAGQFIRVGNLVYFLTRFYNSTYEFWATDGSSVGTIYLGSPPSNGLIDIHGELNGKLIYSQNSSLWTFDGISSNNFFSSLSQFGLQIIKYGTKVFFNGESDSLGVEPYYSDGTVEGTAQLKDIYPGNKGSYPGYFSLHKNTLYFRATDSINGAELWKSDGTSAGTMIQDINPGTASSWPSNLVSSASHLFFTAFDSLQGRELWARSSESLCSYRLTDISFGANISLFGELATSDSLLFFIAQDSLTGREYFVLMAPLQEPIFSKTFIQVQSPRI